MKQWLILLCSVALCSAAIIQDGVAQSQTQSKMMSTKHNFSTSGTGTIKSTNENDLCVFCHTPHVPKQYAATQLWNHKMSEETYTLYSSDYLTSLSYPAPNQPNSRSKLCLSCHDGTIAIGQVYNNQGYTNIQMENDVTTMPLNSPGNLGTSLVNDHPVGFIFDTGKDPELVSRPWPWNTPVKLDPDASNGTVECITCHEPHDNTYTKFLRMDNTDAALCTSCHNKTGWSDAAHKTSTQLFSKPDSSGSTTVGEWSCRSCHTSHGGEGTPYLMTKSEEQTCFASGCHGVTGTGANTKNIQAEMGKTYTHQTTTVVNKHKNPDTETSLNTPNRHAECADCHNSHRAKKGLHAVATNAVSEALKGVRGVIPQYTTAWTQPTTFNEANPSTQENQICFKCHSYNAFGDAVNGVTTIIGPSGDNITDQAMEFNPDNKSTHPVQLASSSPLTANQMTVAWNAVGSQTMYCSDCHGNDIATSMTTPQGPHGSDARFMLTGNAKLWPQNGSGELWSLNDIKTQPDWQSKLFCANCHSMYDGLDFKNNVHNSANHQGSDVKCVTCHVTVPHGAQRSRLIGYESDVKPYNYLGSGTYEKLVITGFQKALTPTSYVKASCSMNTACHGNQIGIYEP